MMPGPLMLLSQLFGAASLIALAYHCWNVGLGPTVIYLLEKYDYLLSMAFGWIEPV